MFYLKGFNIASLDSSKNSLRKEMFVMKTLKHNNVIWFGGACVEYPNVCLLFEPCAKVI